MKAAATLTSFVLFVIALSACGAGGAPPGGGTSGPAPISVSISPKAVSVQVGTTRQFTANVSDGSGVSFTMNPAGGQYGTINSTGLYTAPLTVPGNPTVTITATSTSDSSKLDTATVTIQTGPVFGSFPIEFELKTRAGWQTPVAPATVGLPLPVGLHTDVNTLALQLQTGANVPAQFRVTSRWPGGSIRWVLVDFLADLSGAGGVGQYQLNSGGSGSTTTTNLSVNTTASTITVNTGAVRFVLNRNNFRLFDSVMIDRDNDSQVDDECLVTANMEGVIVSEGATDYLMDQVAPARVDVEEQGPVRVTLVAEGVHRSGLGVNKLNYLVRITAYNNLPFVIVQYTFKNMAGDGVPAATPAAAAAQLAAYETADSIRLDLPLDFGGLSTNVRVGGNPVPHNATLNAAQYLSINQYYAGAHDPTDPENPQPAGFSGGDGSSDPLTNTWPTQDATQIHYDVDSSGSTTTVTQHAPGWMQMAAGTLRVTISVQDFWELHPKELRCQGDGLMRIGIWPATAAPLQVFAGSMKTHAMLLSFDRGGSIDQNGADVRHAIMTDPPRAVCDPRHYHATKVFGDIATTNETFTDVSRFRASSQAFVTAYMTELVDHKGDLLFDRTDGNGAATGHEYGMWHYGDGKHDSPVAGWENHDWEIAKAAFGWFAMSGNTEMLNLAEVSARHFRDVVVLHSDIGLRFDYTEAGNPAVSGSKASQRGKTRYFPNNKQHDLGNYHFGENHLDVFKGASLAEHYLMTGDALSLDVLKEIYTYLRASWKRFFDSGNGGTDSTMTCPTTWLSNGLYIAMAYEVANGLADATASAMTAYALAALRTRQTTTSPRDPSGNGFDDNTGTFRAWEVGHVMEALEYTRWHRNDSSIDTDIENGMNWLLGTNADVYLGNPPLNQFGEFAEFPNGTVDYGGPNLMIGAGYVGAFRKSGNTTWVTAAENLLNSQTQNILDTTIGDDAMRHRSFAQYFRAGPMLLGTVKQ